MIDIEKYIKESNDTIKEKYDTLCRWFKEHKYSIKEIGQDIEKLRIKRKVLIKEKNEIKTYINNKIIKW